MTNWIPIFGLFAIVNILVQVTGRLEPEFHKWQTGITWRNATKMCGEQGWEYDFNSILEKVPSKHDGVEFWIGFAIYGLLTPWIEIMGCYKVSDENILEAASLGLCKRQCGTVTYIGYKKSTNHCVCIGNSHNERNRKDLEDCEDPEENDFLVFVYKELREGLINENTSTTGNCITLCCNCNDRDEMEPTICNGENANIETRCESENRFLDVGLSYQASMIACIKENKLLQPSNGCSPNRRTNVMWSNVFRDEIELQMSQSDGQNLSPARCLAGMISERNGTRVLHILEKDCNEKVNGYVCKHTYSDSTLTANGPTSDMLQTYTADVITTQDLTEGISTSSTSLSNSEGSTLSTFHTQATDDKTTHGVPESQSSTPPFGTAYQITAGEVSVGVVAGATISVIVLLTIVVVLVVCRLRSVGIFKNANGKHTDLSSIQSERKSFPNEINSINPSSNKTYGLFNNNSHYDYAEVKKKVNIDLPIIERDDTYVESSYGEYDQLNVSNTRKIKPKENTYYSSGGVRGCTDSTYDTSNFNDQKYPESNIYDHSYSGGNSDNDYGSRSNNNVEGIYDKSQ